MTDKDIKLLCLDLDGTTLRSSNTISDRVLDALHRARQSGIVIAAASGRPYGSMPEYILESEDIDYFITSNGAAIYGKNEKLLHSAVLDEKDVLSFLELTKEYDLIFEAFIKGLTYTDKRYVDNPLAYGCGEAYIDYVKAAHGHIEDMRDFIYENRKHLDSIEYVCTDKKLRESIRRKIENSPHNMYITTSSENFIEFMHRNATKANAMSYLCRMLGIDEKNCCACGNADNDADMVKLAGLGAAVKNASELCLGVSDIVVASNDDDGVAELVDYILKQV